MADKPHFGVADVAAALRATRGIYSAAALQVGCERTTVARYVEKYESVRRAAEEGRAMIVDAAEGQLARKVAAGEWPAVAFVLSTLGKDRGYAPAQRHEVTGADGGPLEIAVTDARERLQARLTELRSRRAAAALPAPSEQDEDVQSA